MYFYDLYNKIEENKGMTKEMAYNGLCQLIECIGSCAFEYMGDSDRELMWQCLNMLDNDLQNIPKIESFYYDKRYKLSELAKIAPQWLLDEIDNESGVICYSGGLLYYVDWDEEEIEPGSYIVSEDGKIKIYGKDYFKKLWR